MVECMSTSGLKLFWKSCLVYKEFKSSKSNVHLIDSLMNEFEGKKRGKRILDESLMNTFAAVHRDEIYTFYHHLNEQNTGKRFTNKSKKTDTYRHITRQIIIQPGIKQRRYHHAPRARKRKGARQAAYLKKTKTLTVFFRKRATIRFGETLSSDNTNDYNDQTINECTSKSSRACYNPSISRSTIKRSLFH